MQLLLLLLIALSPVLYLLLGHTVTNFCAGLLERMSGRTREGVPWGYSHLILIGLLSYLIVSFILWHLGAPLWCSSLAPFLIVLARFSSGIKCLLAFRFNLHLNFLLWFGIIAFLGGTLFFAPAEISSPWINNYGDLTFHLGMITSFVFGENHAPNYHLYAGERLSYPFFVNFWSALLWWIKPDFRALTLVFFFQWTLLWTLVYNFLDGNKKWLLPWAILLGGGSYLHLGQNSGSLIGHNVPWTLFLTTIWVPQRAAMFGVAGLLGAISLFHIALSSSEVDRNNLLRATLILAALPLVHTHFFIVGAFYCGVVLVVKYLATKLKGGEGAKSLVDLATYLRGMLLSLAFLPWILGKQGMIQFMPGWMTGNLEAGTTRLYAVLHNWISWSTSTVWIVVVFTLWYISKKNVTLIAVCVIFLFGNFVQLAQWDWDQIKLFLGIYIVTLSFWSHLAEKKAIYLQAIVPLLIFPSLYELHLLLLNPHRTNTIYSSDDVAHALKIRSLTKPGDVIAAAPYHNSPITLTGRTLFYGYEGTLSSHGIRYFKRRDLMQDLDRLVSCKVDPGDSTSVCPDYLFWGDAEKRYFEREVTPNFLMATEVPYLFKMVRNRE